MDRRTFETPLGQVWLWGRPDAFADQGPKLVVITSAFATPQSLRILADLLPGSPVLVGDVPGNNCPHLSAQTVEAFSAAYSCAISSLGSPVVLCGNSLGGTIALGVRAPNLRRVVALEPFLSSDWTAKRAMDFRSTLPGGSAEHRNYMRNVFGLDEHTLEPRDHSYQLTGLEVPAIVLVGDAVEPLPSILTEGDQARLRSHPLIRMRYIRGAGHDLPRTASSIVVSTLQSAITAEGSVAGGGESEAARK